MKEIDFIPDWYKADCRRRRRYVRQYMLIAILFAVTMLWSFMMGQYISKASAQVQEVETAILSRTQWIDQATELEQEIARMQSNSTLLEDISPRTQISAMIGELSYLIRENIVLGELSISKDPLQTDGPKEKVTSSAVVQVGPVKETSKKTEIVGSPSRLKVIISGIAAQQADAAGLISRMELSPYFEDVDLVFSRPQKIKDNDVAEFEIRCYVADYQIINKGMR